MLQTDIWEVLGLSLGKDTNWSTEASHTFQSAGKYEDNTSIRPTASFQIPFS
jgi:hypothetical protein